MARTPDVTQLLLDWNAGDASSLEKLLPVVYEELRQLAASHMRRERRSHTLQTTAVVHEAYLRLVDQKRVQWRDRAHFFGAASTAMRRLLVDHARRHRAAKRGAGSRTPIDEAVDMPEERAAELVALDDALRDLERLDARQLKIVELRYFAGLSIEETAAVVDVSPATVKREWSLARAWLHRQLGRSASTLATS